jgi:hypothetical protein
MIIIKPVIGNQCSAPLLYSLSPKGETLAVCNYAEVNTYVRPYYIYNDINQLTQYIPHVALEVQTCYNSDCTHTTFGKAANSKVYSPDILTSGRMCDNRVGTCKDINPGYNKKNLTNWIPVNSKSSIKLQIFLNKERMNPSEYSLFFNNCASFVTQILNKIGIKFSCKFGFFDFPYWCSYKT